MSGTHDGPQGAIDLDRERLLRGRGPGAGPREVARHTRDRVEIGGIPVPDLLESTATQAAATRGDPAARADRVVGQRRALAAELLAVADRARTTARRTGGRLVVVAIVVLVARLLRSRRGWRSTGSPPASPPGRARRSRRRRPVRST